MGNYIKGMDGLLHILECRGHEDIFSCWRICYFLIIIMPLLAFPISAVNSQHDISLIGKVVDAKTESPLEGVKLRFKGWVSTGYDWIPYEMFVTTDKAGHYNVSLSKKYYTITVIADDPETPGLDYIPAQMELSLSELNPAQGEISADFELQPGASVILKGSPEFVEFGKEPAWAVYTFSSLDPRYSTIGLTRAVRFYEPLTWSDLGLEQGEIVVPSDTPLAVGVSAYWYTGGSERQLDLMDDNGSCFYRCSQGSRIVVNISRVAMIRNIAVIRDRLSYTRLQVERLDLNGIGVKSEMDDLDTAFGLLDSARLALRNGSYYECFLSLREAYIMDEGIRSRAADALADAAFSPIPLTFLLVLSGFGLASILIEGEARRIAIGFIVISIMLGIYLYVSPGLRLTDPFLLLASCTVAAIIAIGLAVLTPRIRGDVVTPSGIALASSLTSTFSLASRNLKRRRLRSSLILASILTLVFGFTAFTSFQIRTLVVARDMMPSHPNPEPPEGLMVAGPLISSYSLSTSMIGALRADPLVSSVAPKTDTSPTSLSHPMAQLISDRDNNMTVLGAIGLSSEEVRMNRLDAAIVNGAYALEGETTSIRGILISAKAAERLQVAPGDRVKFIAWRYSEDKRYPIAIVNYTIVGIFDDRIFEGIVDLDAKPIRPYAATSSGIVYLSADSVAVFNWKELIRLGIGQLTRINVQTKSGRDVMPLSYQLAKKWHCVVYASADNNVIIYLYSPAYGLSGGAAIPMLLVLVGLNVLACTLNAVYERRREVVTLSLIGLNPSQIGYMFLVESGLVAFVAGVLGYVLGIGVPRLSLSLGGPGFLTEKISWAWIVAVIMMAVALAVLASAIPAMRASTIATPKLPLKWKLEHLPAAGDEVWQLHMPQLVSQLEIERFIGFVKGMIERTQFFKNLPDRMELKGMAEEGDQERDVKRLLFTYDFGMDTRAFKTENELVVTRPRGSSAYNTDLVTRIVELNNFDPAEVTRRTASAVRKMMLQWATTMSAERWGPTDELVRIDNLDIASGGKGILSGINLSIKKGEILGVVGEGGRALLLAIAGLCKPSGGTVQFLGMDTYERRNEVKRAVGILLQGTGLPARSSPKESLTFMAKLGGIRGAEKAVGDVLERCGLERCAGARISDLSQGDKVKLMVAQALIGKPSLLLLEDTFEGFNQDEMAEVTALLKRLRRSSGMTIVFCGKSVDELGFCDRIAIL